MRPGPRRRANPLTAIGAFFRWPRLTCESKVTSCIGLSRAHKSAMPPPAQRSALLGVRWNESGRTRTVTRRYGSLRSPPGDALWRREPQAIRTTADAGRLPGGQGTVRLLGVSNEVSLG